MKSSQFFTAFILFLLTIGNIVPVYAENLPTQNFTVPNQALYESLEGNWLYFDEQFYSGSEARQNSAQGIEVNVPVEFQELNEKVSGYGTFALHVQVPETYIGQILAIRSPFEYSAVKVYVDDQELFESGQVGNSSETHETMLESKIGYFEVKQSQFTIAVQISSFQHIRGGFANALILGESDVVNQKFNYQVMLTLLFVGMICTLGMLTFIIGLFRKEEKAFLAFGLFCLVISVRTLVTVPFIYRYFPLNISYELATKIEYITTSLSALFYVLFIYYLYKEIFSRKIVVLNSVLLLGIVGVTVFTEPFVFQNIFFQLIVAEFLIILYLIYIFYKALVQRKKLIIPNLLGISLTLGGMILDYLSGLGVITIFPVTLFCLTLNVIIVVLSIAYQYTGQFKKAKQLNDELLVINTSLDKLVNKRTAELSKANEQLQKRVDYDGLTNVFNRHYFNETLAKYFAKAQAEDRQLAVMIFDLDEFKKYNDTYGHIKGDEILIKVAKVVQASLSNQAIFARYGGEEFAVILPNCGYEEGKQQARKICEAVEMVNLEHQGRAEGKVTISVGGAAMDGADYFKTEIQLLECADKQLYESKHKGRNQVHFVGALSYTANN